MGFGTILNTIHHTSSSSWNRLRCSIMETLIALGPAILSINVFILTIWVIILDAKVTKLKKIIG